MKDFIYTETTLALIQKVGIMLIHSLWIGTVAAILAAAIVMLTRHSRPEIRYNLLTGLMLMFLVATGFVLFQLKSPQPSGVALQFQTYPTTANAAQNQIPNLDAIHLIINFLSRNIYMITLIWLMVVVFKTTTLVLGVYRIYQLKTQKIYSIGAYWEQRVSEFAKEMGLTRPIRIFQSGLAQVPMVMGHFKPVILVPLGAITSIPADQIEMVLLHELAHIRRLDFLVNFVQRLTELLFFFNPGFLWISRLIHDERENCCDDMALRNSGNQAVYIHALLSFREYQIDYGVYQLAFSGKSGLVQRVKRIASRSNTTLGALEKTALIFLVILSFTFSIVYAQQTVPKHDKVRLSQIETKKQSSVTLKVTEKTQRNVRSGNSNPVIAGPKKPSDPGALGLPDTLQPLQKSLSPFYQPASPALLDSSGSGRLVPVLRQPYVQTLPVQPLRSHQLLSAKAPLVTRPLAVTEKILTAIESQGITISRDNVDFKISNNELIINGIKQPDTVHQRILDAVLNSQTDIIDFTYGRHR